MNITEALKTKMPLKVKDSNKWLPFKKVYIDYCLYLSGEKTGLNLDNFYTKDCWLIFDIDTVTISLTYKQLKNFYHALYRSDLPTETDYKTIIVNNIDSLIQNKNVSVF